jgi:hydroxymethylbilane synthase
LQKLKDFSADFVAGCSTPISALAIEENGMIQFKGNILSLDGKKKIEIEKKASSHEPAMLANLPQKIC